MQQVAQADVWTPIDVYKQTTKLSQVKLGRLCGVHQNSISQWLRDDDVTTYVREVHNKRMRLEVFRLKTVKGRKSPYPRNKPMLIALPA